MIGTRETGQSGTTAEGRMRPGLLVRMGGEFYTKSSRTRRRLLRALVSNIRAALAERGVAARVEAEWSRVRIYPDDLQAARRTLVRVYGVYSVAEVCEVPYSSLEDLVAKVAPMFHERVAGRKFAVRARRRRAPFTSQDVGRELGAALLPFSAGVDLDEPEVEVRLEVARGRAFVIDEETPGPGGFPLGTGGRALALFSGGFDSPVATWRVMRRGIRVALVVYDLGGCGQVDQALAVAKELALGWSPGREMWANVVDFAPVVSALVRRVDPRLRQILLKRAMYRAGEMLARELGSEALVTGESLGQVSTQTLRNLAVAEQTVGIPVLRPLVGSDKQETMDEARRIGTHDVSAAVKEHCSIATGPVETRANPDEVLAAEGELGQEVDDAWLRRAVENRRVVRLKRWKPSSEAPDYVVEEVPEGALVVDVREPEEGEPVGDLRLPFSRALEELDGLDPSREYLLVCASGRRSELLARELIERGYRAYSLQGGVDRLRQPASS